ncbi:MAG: tRNA (adenosine(37)-N6)-dimethylallyltransferase MiaA [Bacteroidota bacterium]|nr:tRNA (adenosine(37)-N6)-dimethylallyltransferase MiaA [Bacteroidota bacterium]
MRMNTLIVVLGPTGIGKSDISIQLANYFSTDIISADSRQFFRELSIGTAVPAEEDLKSVIHHFIHSRSIHDYYNVSEYETEAIDLINQLFKSKNPLILTGGSMLYIDTICKGIDDIPTVTPEIRQEVVNWYAENGLEALQQRLLNLDPEYHSIADLNNPKRLLHAVEICQLTGKTFTSFRKNTVRERPFLIVKIGINQNREILYQRINERVERMMDAGLLDEARGVYPHKDLNSLNTVGYKELFAFFDGNCTLDEAVDLIKRNSRKYARKQLTWFRRDNEITWFEPEQIQEIIAFTEQKLNEHDR